MMLEAFLPALDAPPHHNCKQQDTCSVGAWSSGKCSGTSTAVSRRVHALYRDTIPDLAHDEVCYQYVSGMDRNRSIPYSGQYQQVLPTRLYAFSSPTTWPRSKHWPKAGIMLWRSSTLGGLCPAFQGWRDQPLLCRHCHLYGLGAGECSLNRW